MSIYLTRTGQTHFEHRHFNARKIDRFSPKSIHVDFGDNLMIFSATETGISDAMFLAKFFHNIGVDLTEMKEESEQEENPFEPEEAEDIEDRAADIREEEDGIAEAIDVEVEQMLDDVEVADA